MMDIKQFAQPESGKNQPGRLLRPGCLRTGAGPGFHPLLAVRRARVHGAQYGRLPAQLHGRGRGHRRPRPKQATPGVPQQVQAPRQQGLLLRSGQRAFLHLHLPRLAVRHRGPPVRRAVLRGRVPQPAAAGSERTGRGPHGGFLQGAHLRLLGPRGDAFGRLPGRHALLPRPPGHPRRDRRHRDRGRQTAVHDADQLEAAGRQLRLGHTTTRPPVTPQP